MHFNLFGKGRSLRWAITLTCEMAFIFFGYDQGVMGGLVTHDNFLSVVNYPSDSAIGFMLSIYNLGCFTGCVLNFIFGDYFGRRRAIWISMAWIVVGATLQTTAFSLAHLMIGRFLTGIGIGTGIETSTVPMYQAELCEAAKRGRLVCSEICFIGIGLVIGKDNVLSNCLPGYGVVHVEGPAGWRVPVDCQLIFAVICVVMVFGLPESPRYLYSKGRNAEALQVLCDVYDKPNTDEKILLEEAAILQALRVEDNASEYSFRRIFKKDRIQTGRRVLLAYGMQFINQMGGINLVVYYMPTILKNNIGVSANTSVLIGAAINCMFLIGSLLPATLSDRIGRCKPMMWGSLGCGLSMMVVSILLSFHESAIAHSTSIASVAFFFTFMLIYGMSVAAVPWCYVPEILPLHARAKGTAIGISSNWIWNFFIVQITPIAINRLQWKAYLIFMVLSLAFIPLVYFCYPETANLTLEQIDLLYIEPDTAPVKVAARLQKQSKEGEQGVVEDKSEVRTDVVYVEAKE